MVEFTPADETGKRILFTPGPLTTRRSVREEMLVDIGSWDADCIRVTAEIRSRVLALAGDHPDYECVPLQGCGTYAVEAMLGAAVPREGKLLVLVNGAYGNRMTLIAEKLDLPYSTLFDPENQPHDPERLDAALRDDPDITHVACVHCETTTGVLSPLRELGLVVARHGRSFLADTISSFGAYPIDLDAGPLDWLVVPANKCIEGVPGCAFVIARRDALERSRGNARSLSLDVLDQWSYMEKTGRFRYSPPTHVLLACLQALREFETEGGLEARAARYRENHEVLIAGMRQLGFREYVAPEHQSYLITAFRFPDEGFEFQGFYDALHARGYIIYPGKVSDVDTFRIGTIGSIGAEDVRGLLKAIAEVLKP